MCLQGDVLIGTSVHFIYFLQLLAHEFLFNKEMMEASNAKLAYALGSMCLGCGLMALLGKWA